MDDKIAYIRVHPGIGIARLGNSVAKDSPLKLNENFFIGPEAPGVVVDPGGSGGPGPDGGTYRDSDMGLKRQAQRFRIYAYDADDNVIGELNGTNTAQISWRVHVQNMKAANYAFQGAYLLDDTQMRNPNIQGPGAGQTMRPEDRTDLIVDPGVATISTMDGREKPLTGSCFTDTTSRLPEYLDFEGDVTPSNGWVDVSYTQATGIELGRLQLDSEARLLFIAGPGESKCVTTPKIRLSNPSEHYQPPNGVTVTGAPDGNDHAYQPLINQFAYFNVPGWWDDTCGGEIDATVELADGTIVSTRDGVTGLGDDGERNAARGGWVVTAPPKYAPDMYHVVSIKDRIFEAFPQADPSLAAGEQTEFWRDIYPILSRAVNYGWVSAEAGGVTPENRNLAHGPKQAGNLLSDANMTAFTDPDPAFNQVRTQIYRIMRQADMWSSGSNDTDYPQPQSPMQELVAGFPRLIDTLPADPPPASAPPPGDETAGRTARGNKMPKLWGTAGKPLQNQQLGHDLPNQYLSLTANALAHMQNWAQGTFVNMRPGTFEPPVPMQLDEYSVAQQPLAMDCAAVEPTIGGGFHPGIEFPYLICYRQLFEDAFRVKAGTAPGSVAAYMSSPWQGDYWSCNTAWWPVQRPDIVFTFHGPDSPRTYCEWFRGFDETGQPLSSTDGYDQMVYAWDKLGMVLPLRDESGNPVTQRGSVVFQEYERNPVLSQSPVTGEVMECDDDMH
ncbi:MAG: LodA/GoxA family CTQ-dependent oxidase [Rhodobacter sp.]|nr:LodA/GoxA family CTQ-dependent oxidase [Rhodobacter sp.]